MTIIIETNGLVLSTWCDDDATPYFHINQDPEVTKYLRRPLTMERVRDFISPVNAHHAKIGYAVWATKLKTTDELMGFIGLNYVEWPAHFTPAVEIAWRLGSQYWGNGYATEGAHAALNYGFTQCNLPKIVAFTIPANARSIRVIEKLGLKRDIYGDFFHPEIDRNSPLSRHMLYRLSKDDWAASKQPP